MSKVVLFSTRAIGENTLFGTDCKRRILNQDNSPIFKYFTGVGASDDEKKELGKYFPSGSCFDRIKNYCSNKGVWSVDYEKMEEETVLDFLSSDKRLNNDEYFTRLLTEYYSGAEQASIVFNADSFMKYLSNNPNNNPNIRFALNIDNPNMDVAIGERFSIYVKPQPGEESEFVFMAIWPLGRTESKEENGYNVWVSTLVQQICKIVKNCEEITLLLHDKDICESQPFRIIIPQTEYTVDPNRNVNLSVAIFQHTPGDPINVILNKPETDLSEAYKNIFTVLTKAEDMRKAGNAHTTHQVYRNLVNALDNKTQAE